MATATATSPTGELTDLVDTYGTPEELPRLDWFQQLRLEQPRRNLRCLGVGTLLAKRGMDLLVAGTMLVLLAPVMLFVAVLVRCTSPGPIIFKQVRIGLNERSTRRDRRKQFADLPEAASEDRRTGGDRRQEFAFGRAFVLYKFRTMRVDAEKHGAQLAVRGDPRVTPIGRFLRKTRLDELPQLWNVLRGEMSLVGPRPERPEFIETLSRKIPGYLDRLGLKPGLTGLAQVVNGYDSDLQSFKRKVAFDLLYLQNCCLWNDLKILVRTVGVVLTGKGAL